MMNDFSHFENSGFISINQNVNTANLFCGLRSVLLIQYFFINRIVLVIENAKSDFFEPIIIF